MAAVPIPPSITIDLDITPTKFALDPSPPTITLTAIVYYPEPITIFKHATVFNFALRRSPNDFNCEKITTEDVKPINIGIKKGGKRLAFNCEYGGHDDRFFVTLHPETLVVFEEVFHLANRSCEHAVFHPGHKYRFGTKHGETVDWWRVGEKKDVMSPSSEFKLLGEASGEPICLETKVVELEVL